LTVETQAEEGRGKESAADATVRVAPGICGFDCVVRVRRVDKRTVAVQILGSECKQIGRLAAELNQMSLRELFMPLTRNPVYVSAEKSGCHPSCVVPAGVLKAVEAVLGMAIPRDVRIRFETDQRGEP